MRVWAPVIALGLLSQACQGRPAGDARGAGARRYDVRGEVVRLPAARGGRGELMVRHEAIPGFVDRSGQVVGMDAMVMEFEVEQAVVPRDLAPGDKGALRLVMDWDHPPVTIERIERLPATTELRFGRVSPPGDGGS